MGFKRVTFAQACYPDALSFSVSKCPDSDEETELHVHVTVPAQQPESVPESASLSNENGK